MTDAEIRAANASYNKIKTLAAQVTLAQRVKAPEDLKLALQDGMLVDNEDVSSLMRSVLAKAQDALAAEQAYFASL